MRGSEDLVSDRNPPAVAVDDGTMGCTPLSFSEHCMRYDFGGDHPLNSVRLSLTVDLVGALGLDSPLHGCVATSAPATEEDLALVHDPGYVAAVRALSVDPAHPILST